MITKAKVNFSKLRRVLESFLTKGSQRSLSIKRNIYSLFIIKGLQIAVSFLLVPLTIGYINADNYGIWLTVSSIIAWMSFFDIGLNNGLRNKFAEAKAKKNDVLAQKYVSTTYAILLFISIFIFVVYIVSHGRIDWNRFLNTSVHINELEDLVLIVISYFSLRFTLSTISIICIADQKPAFGNIINLAGEVLSLIIISILVRFTEGNLIYLGLALCISPLLMFSIFNLVLFSTKYKSVRPKINMIDFKLGRGLFNLGWMFFVIQVAMIIQFQTSNIIIMRAFSGADVTVYNVTYKYFSVIVMILSIALTPVWSSVTEAYHTRDIPWIRNILKKFNYITFSLMGFGIIMLLFSEFAFRLWLGSADVKTSMKLSFWILLYVYSLMYGRIHVSILNGIGALRLQMFSAILSPLIFILSVYFFIKVLALGIISVPIAGIIANFNGYLIAPMQYRAIFVKGQNGKFWYR